MNHLAIHLAGDGCWPDLNQKREAGKLTWSALDKLPVSIARLPGGMSSGRSSVAIRYDLDDGQVLVVEWPMRLLKAAIDAFHKVDEAEAAEAAAAGKH